MNCALQIYIRRDSILGPVVDGFFVEDLFLKDTDVSDMCADLLRSSTPHLLVPKFCESGMIVRVGSVARVHSSLCSDPEMSSARFGMLVVDAQRGGLNRYCFIRHTNTHGVTTLPVYRPASLVQFLGNALNEADQRRELLLGLTPCDLLRDLSCNAALITADDIAKWFPGLYGIAVAA